jgi:hypothetical protein
MSAEDIRRPLAQLALNPLHIDSQALSYIVDCLVNSGLLFIDMGVVSPML